MSILPNSFPRCQLHGCKIVNKFPPNCPLSTENPLDTLQTMKNSAFAATRANTDESGHRFRVLDCCERCISKNLANPTVSRLRRTIGAWVAMLNVKSVNTHAPDVRVKLSSKEHNNNGKHKSVRGRGRWYLQEATIHG